MPRFVILRHEPSVSGGKPLHWDFMLESGDVLRTWSLESEPQPSCVLFAEELAAHRKDYLDYEGPISGDRGFVQQWDAGTYEVTREGPAELRVQLRGRLLSGEASLARESENPQRWIFTMRSERISS